MYDRVLVPTDGSDAATAALEHAIGIARRNDAELHTLYATALGELTDSLDEETLGATVERIQRAGETAVQDLAEQAANEGITAETAVVDGPAAQAILEYVEDNEIDVVVMATRGRTGEQREFIGSVTERVVRLSPVPVLTVRADEA